MVAVLPQGHPLAARTRLALTDLAREPWTAPSADGIVARACRAAGFEPRVVIYTSDPLAVRADRRGRARGEHDPGTARRPWLARHRDAGTGGRAAPRHVPLAARRRSAPSRRCADRCIARRRLTGVSARAAAAAPPAPTRGTARPGSGCPSSPPRPRPARTRCRSRPRSRARSSRRAAPPARPRVSAIAVVAIAAGARIERGEQPEREHQPERDRGGEHSPKWSRVRAAWFQSGGQLQTWPTNTGSGSSRHPEPPRPRSRSPAPGPRAPAVLPAPRLVSASACLVDMPTRPVAVPSRKPARSISQAAEILRGRRAAGTRHARAGRGRPRARLERATPPASRIGLVKNEPALTVSGSSGRAPCPCAPQAEHRVADVGERRRGRRREASARDSSGSGSAPRPVRSSSKRRPT